MNDDLDGFNVLRFNEENEKWLDYVCACRKGEQEYLDYDIIIGSEADDDVFKTVDMYFKGVWSKKKALDELRYYQMNDQICILNQKICVKKSEFTM